MRNRSISKVVSLKNAFGFELRILLGRWFGSGTLYLSFMNWKMISGAFSIYWGWKSPRNMPEDSDILEFTRNGDLTAVKLLLSSKKGSRNGQSLLHVSTLSSRYRFR
jgi:hypothetical protein